jgi:hypothetical protein
MAEFNEGIKSFDCASGTDIAAYRLVAYRGANAVAAFDANVDTLLAGVTTSASYEDKVAVKDAKFPGSVKVAVELGATVTDKDLLKVGTTTDGTVMKATDGTVAVGYACETATSAADAHAIIEVVLFSGAQLAAAISDTYET